MMGDKSSFLLYSNLKLLAQLLAISFFKYTNFVQYIFNYIFHLKIRPLFFRINDAYLRTQICTLVYRIIVPPRLLSFGKFSNPIFGKFSNPPNFISTPPIINLKDFSKSQKQKSQIYCMEQQKGVNELLSKYSY